MISPFVLSASRGWAGSGEGPAPWSPEDAILDEDGTEILDEDGTPILDEGAP